MPTLPKKQPRRNYIVTPQRKGTSDQTFLNSKRWRKVRGIYKSSVGPICEACIYANEIGEDSHICDTDHIVPTELGGDYTDFRNLNRLCKYHHNKKSGKEAHSETPLVESEKNQRGYLIPINKKDIWTLLTS